MNALVRFDLVHGRGLSPGVGTVNLAFVTDPERYVGAAGLAGIFIFPWKCQTCLPRMTHWKANKHFSHLR
jgi:hypothetical protein